MEFRKHSKRVSHSNFVLSLGLFAWGLLMAWVAFGDTPHSAVVLVVATLFFLVIFSIPAILLRIGDITGDSPAQSKDGEVEVHTGPLPISAARLETLMPVIGVAVGFTLIGFVFMMVDVS